MARASALSKAVIFLTMLKNSGKASQFKTARGPFELSFIVDGIIRFNDRLPPVPMDGAVHFFHCAY